MGFVAPHRSTNLFMKTTKKGYKKEKLCRDDLQKDNWLVVFKSVRYRFGTVDFAKLFDVVAVKHTQWRFISVKHFGKNNFYLQHQDKIREFKEQYGWGAAMFELWLWKSPRWEGRGLEKIWCDGQWLKVVID